MYKRILVPVDGSEAAAVALAEALRLAKANESKVSLLHVYESVIYSFPDGPIDLTPALRRDGERIVDEASARAREAGVAASTSVVEARGKRFAEVIVDLARAEGDDLIIMGTHGRRGFEHLVLGSVAEGVARRTTVPILLVRRKS